MKRFMLLLLTLTIPMYGKTVIWLTGLPCSGKTTLANKFHSLYPNSIVLDGDDIRKGLNCDLGFSKEDREENIRRVTEMAALCLKSVDTVIVALVSPYVNIRQYARQRIIEEGAQFLEVFVEADVKTCQTRDVKGMYAKAVRGEIPKFTGISAPYEHPIHPDVVCHTKDESIMQSTQKIIDALHFVNPRKPHALFIGRWSPFHQGHFAIMKKVYEEDPSRPLLIFVRDNAGEYWSAEYRKNMVEASMKAMNIPATVMIIPDIDSVNWGRDVGYQPRQIEVSERIQGVSGTRIREGIKEGNDEWKAYVCDGVADYILSQPQ